MSKRGCVMGISIFEVGQLFIYLIAIIATGLFIISIAVNYTCENPEAVSDFLATSTEEQADEFSTLQYKGVVDSSKIYIRTGFDYLVSSVCPLANGAVDSSYFIINLVGFDAERPDDFFSQLMIYSGIATIVLWVIIIVFGILPPSKTIANIMKRMAEKREKDKIKAEEKRQELELQELIDKGVLSSDSVLDDDTKKVIEDYNKGNLPETESTSEEPPQSPGAPPSAGVA